MHRSKSENQALDILDDLKKLLINEVKTSQEALCQALEAKGHSVNQSKISRLLRKINAVKLKNEQGELVYKLPHDATPPSISTTLADAIIEITANESMIVITTTPGAASLIARIIDHKSCEVLGTIAGDDTIFVVPISIKQIDVSLGLVKTLLGMN